MQGVLGTRSRIEVEQFHYLFVHFNVTERVETSGNTRILLETDGRTAELFGTDCTGGMSGQEWGLFPSDVEWFCQKLF